MGNKSDGQWILNALDLAASACQSITDAGACEVCPIHGACLEDSCLTDVAYALSARHWRDFLDLADDVQGYVRSDEAEADYWDGERKAASEELAIDEKWGI